MSIQDCLVWIALAAAVNGQLSITGAGSNTVDSTTYVIFCQISSFTSLGQWDRDGTVGVAQCTSTICIIQPPSQFIAGTNSSGIYIRFNPLKASEKGIVWTCKHGSDSFSFNIDVETSTTNSTVCTCTCRELLILLILLIDVIAFIVLLYIKIKNIEQLDYERVVNIAQHPFGKWIIFELRLEFLVMVVIKCIQAIIVVPVLIVICKCPVGHVIGIAFLLIVVCPVIYMVIFWVVIWNLCRRKLAVNRVDPEITKEYPRKSINGDAGLRSPVTPGRKLPPLPPLTRTDPPPLIQTDPDKLVNTEKKKTKKKKTKTEVNEEDQAETNKAEINDQVDAENLPETNKISD